MMDILINTYDTMAKILLVEDEVNIASFIERGLLEFGHEVYVAYDGAAGWELTQKNDFQLLILDIIMPKMNGLQLCKQYRQRFGYHAPVIMLTALGTTEDIVSGLDAGADDYVTKPFYMGELMARIRAGLRKTGTGRQEEIHDVFSTGSLTVDYEKRKVLVEGEEVHLTPIEYKILLLLIANRGKVLTHNYIIREIWGYAEDIDAGNLRVFMATLRRKIEKDPANPE